MPTAMRWTAEEVQIAERFALRASLCQIVRMQPFEIRILARIVNLVLIQGERTRTQRTRHKIAQTLRRHHHGT